MNLSPYAYPLLYTLALLATPAAVADDQLPAGLAADAWQKVQAAIVEQVDAEIAAGDDEALRGGLAAVHGLIRRHVLVGDYADLPPQDAPGGPEFGHSVAIDGEWLAVGAPGTTRSQPGTALVGEWGAVFLYQRVAGNWTLRHRILGGSGTEPERCGHAVALQMPYLVVGCPNASSAQYAHTGRWRAFRVTSDALFNAGNGQFAADVAIGAQCGAAVAISANYLAFACPRWAPAGADGEGRVYIHGRDDAETIFVFETSLRAPAEAFRFGSALALRQPPRFPLGEPGNVRLAIGASQAVYAGSIFPRGSVYIHNRSLTQPNWTLAATLRPAPVGSDQAVLAGFGAALAMNRLQLLVGAPNNRWGGVQTLPGPGTAHRYALNNAGGTWSWAVQENGGAANVPDGLANGLRFGAAVGLGFDNLIAIGAPGTPSVGGGRPEVGLAEIRRFPAGDWSLNQYWGELRPAGNTPLHNNAHFGTSLDFDVAGRTLAVGVPGHRILAQPIVPRGQVWLYVEDTLFADGFQCAAGLPGC